MKRFIATSLAVILILASVLAAAELLLPALEINNNVPAPEKTGFHLGVSFCGNTVEEAKLLVDRVRSYTNLFVVQSGPVSVNETALNEIVDYVVAANLDVIVYFGYFNRDYPWQISWLDYAKQTWGNRFLGIYLNDEPGGKVLDANWVGNFSEFKLRDSSLYYSHTQGIDLYLNGSLAIDNTEAANHFVTAVQNGLGLNQLKTRSIHSYTSDYALYWFDYKGGYDTLFGQLGWNHSIPQTIALTRGAARVQNKTWGAIITWTYDQPPYLVSGPELYSQLMAAYMAGAKYAVVFDYPQIGGNPYGILLDEHFSAMEKFWSNIQTLTVSGGAEAALVMPSDYGWGMRSQQDRIWGLWAPDGGSTQIWNIKEKLLSQYGAGLDIVYDDPQFPLAQAGYRQLYFWNQTL